MGTWNLGCTHQTSITLEHIQVRHLDHSNKPQLIKTLANMKPLYSRPESAASINRPTLVVILDVPESSPPVAILDNTLRQHLS